MKKIIILLQILITMIAIGCSNNTSLENKYIEGKDAQYMFMRTDSDRYITKSKDGYYFINGIYLYFCDFESMESVPLCSKPNCLHDKETDSSKKYYCNAFVFTGGDSKLLTVYDNYIYCYIDCDFLKEDTTKSELIRISLDGSERKTICELEPNISSMALHRGKLYYSTSTQLFEGEDEKEEIYIHKLKEYNLSNSKSKELISSKYIDGGISDIIPIGNNLIFYEWGIDTENQKIIVNDYIFNINKNEKYAFAKALNAASAGCIGITDKEIVFIPRLLNNNEYILDDNLYEYNLETKKSQVLFSNELEGNLFYSDDKYIYFDNKSFSQTEVENNNYNREITVCDKNGVVVDNINVSEIEDYFLFNSGDENYMFIKGENEEGAYIKYIDKSKIGTGNAKLETLFKLEAKYLDTSVSR